MEWVLTPANQLTEGMRVYRDGATARVQTIRIGTVVTLTLTDGRTAILRPTARVHVHEGDL